MLKKKIGWEFDNTYSKLSKNMFSKLSPIPVREPNLVLFNHSLSKEIGLNFSEIDDKEMALIFSGNKLPEGSETLAQAYAGHQFGHFTILGDGRALTMGEHVSKNKKRYDIQFKGSGITPYSRNADGRAALGPMLREYIISEAMHNLKIASTRSLALVSTGEEVIRETILDGAILTRVASSHIRVGTFQYALISEDKKDLKKLFDYTIKRHYSHIKKKENSAVELLKIVLEKQINLVCDWMRVGFVHGVMNTDNMTISGETIDYGPCAFMDKYDPKTVFSSIDHYGRYAYCNQPLVTKWNLERFAETLLPLISENNEKAIKVATDVLNEFPKKYKISWLKMMRNKLGIVNESNQDEELIIELLTWMHQNQADYTNTFCYIMGELKQKSEIYNNKEFISWKKKWENRVKEKNNSIEKSLSIMHKTNPRIIPRNYLLEEVIKDVVENKDSVKIKDFLKVLKNPYTNFYNLAKYQSLPPANTKEYVTFCGT